MQKKLLCTFLSFWGIWNLNFLGDQISPFKMDRLTEAE